MVHKNHYVDIHTRTMVQFRKYPFWDTLYVPWVFRDQKKYGWAGVFQTFVLSLIFSVFYLLILQKLLNFSYSFSSSLAFDVRDDDDISNFFAAIFLQPKNFLQFFSLTSALKI